MTRKIFCSPLYAKPCLVDIAPTLLRPNNWVFLAGKAHTDFRKGLNGLFVRQSLEIYLPGQEEVYKKYFARWLAIFEANGMKPIPFMHEFREIMCATSCRTFVGHYLDDAAVKKIADDYYNITAALELVNFPFVVPFTRAWRGKKAADMVIHAFELCATKAKVRMRQGAEVTCIMDAWIKQMLESEAWREAEAAGKPLDLSTKPAQLLRLFSDTDISLTLMTFLFASQDATSSATTWMFQLMADRPEHLEKIRAEQLAVRGGDKDKPLTMDMMEAMTYTRAVVKETLRYRPPVSMVPYETKIDFPITESYTVPKGSMVIPTVHTALQDPEAYPNPSSFDPERWITGDADAQVKNWLVFGAGPHYCIGQVYATYNLMALIGNASLALDWRHEVTDLSEEIKVFATIFPMDDCLLSFGKR